MSLVRNVVRELGNKMCGFTYSYSYTYSLTNYLKMGQYSETNVMHFLFSLLTHWGPVTQICVICVFAL
jgi:hypothetical protein